MIPPHDVAVRTHNRPGGIFSPGHFFCPDTGCQLPVARKRRKETGEEKG